MYDLKRSVPGIAMITISVILCMAPAVFHHKETPAAPGRGSGRAASVPDIIHPAGTISVNESDAFELTELPGVGETIAELIILERNNNGVYYYPEDLTAVSGIGIKKLSQFRDMLNLD